MANDSLLTDLCVKNRMLPRIYPSADDLAVEMDDSTPTA